MPVCNNFFFWPINARTFLVKGLLIILFISQSHAFSEIRPGKTSNSLRRYIKRALKVLSKNDSPIAKHTLKSIKEGRVKIGLLRDLTKNDYKKILLDLKRNGKRTKLTLKDYKKIRSKNSAVLKEISRQFGGYMWDDRIYVARGLPARTLAKTLIHEVNHVINKSHIGYYTSETNAFIEEYRAFYVEALYESSKKPNKKNCSLIKKMVIDLYHFKKVSLSDIPDIPPGILIPTTYAWDNKN